MLIGIDASALTKSQPTGVEFYVQQVLQAMMQLPLTNDEQVVLYAPAPQPEWLVLPVRWQWRHLGYPLPKGWTHGRLSLELLLRPPDVFFSPAHEVPLLHRKAKIVSTVHDVAFRHAPRAYAPRSLRRQEWAVRRAAKQSAVILAVSEATKRDLVSLYKIPEERITVTPLALRKFTSTKTATEVLTKYGLEKGKYLLFVGRIEEKKGLNTLVEAYIELRRRLGADFPYTLALAGKPGYGAQGIEQRVQDAGLSKEIRFLGYVPDDCLPALYANARAFCFPSNGEGFGLPALEALASGVPVVGSDIPALREVAGAAAIFAPAGDVASWIAALQQIATNEEARSRIMMTSKQQIAKFSWSKTAELTLNTLRHVCTQI